jgi:hypothetical protein
VLLQLIPAFEWNEREIPGQPLKQSKFHQEAGGLAKGEKKGEASQERPPLLNEPVGGRLIGVLYCLARRKSFHYFSRALENKKRR